MATPATHNGRPCLTFTSWVLASPLFPPKHVLITTFNPYVSKPVKTEKVRKNLVPSRATTRHRGCQNRRIVKYIDEAGWGEEGFFVVDKEELGDLKEWGRVHERVRGALGGEEGWGARGLEVVGEKRKIRVLKDVREIEKRARGLLGAMSGGAGTQGGGSQVEGGEVAGTQIVEEDVEGGGGKRKRKRKRKRRK